MTIEEEAFNRYFGTAGDTPKKTIKKDINDSQKVYANKQSDRQHKIDITTGTDHEVSFNNKSDAYIKNTDDLVEIIKQLCNAAWGQGWGEFTPDLKTGEDSSDIVLPQILADTNTRDISKELGALKPILMDIQPEYDGEGNPTGDSFLIYRQWFDTNIEFDIFGRNSKEARELMYKFEDLMTVYSGYLKRKGISEVFFLREITPKSSINYNKTTPMRSILYYVRFESVNPIRVSTINEINAKIGANQISSQQVTTLLQEAKENKTQTIELDFFDGDNGITYQ